MARKGISKAQESGNGHSLPSTRPGGVPASQMDPSLNSDEVAQRAYQIFEREGRVDGRDMEHWLQAERELRAEREASKNQGAINPAREAGLRPQDAPRSARQMRENSREHSAA